MSKSVLIPSTEKPMWECEINGKVYAYKAGLITTVPDEVASVIENIYGQIPLPAPGPEDGQVWMYKDGEAGWQTITIPEPEKELPPYDNGKYLKSTASGVEWATPTATVPDATLETAGVVKMGAYVDFIPLDSTPYVDNIAVCFNYLRQSLIEAGIISGVYPDDGGLNGDGGEEVIGD